MLERRRMTLAQAAPLWGLTPETLSRMCLRGEVPDAVKLGKRWFVTEAGIIKMFDNANRKSARRK